MKDTSTPSSDMKGHNAFTSENLNAKIMGDHDRAIGRELLAKIKG